MALEELHSFVDSELVIVLSLELLSFNSSRELEEFAVLLEELLAAKSSELLSGDISGFIGESDELVGVLACSAVAELEIVWVVPGIGLSMDSAEVLSVEQPDSPARQGMQRDSICRNRFFFMLSPFKNTFFEACMARKYVFFVNLRLFS